VPDELVSPTPRSQIRATTRPGPSAGRPERSSGGKTGVGFEQRPDPFDLGRVAFDDRVRVSDRDRHELDSLEPLGRADLDRPQLLLDQFAADPRVGHPLADADSHLPGTASIGEPAGSDPSPVAGQLGPGAVGIPDHDLGLDALDTHDFEDAVGLVLRRELARALRR
jgi:hypothetical protein